MSDEETTVDEPVEEIVLPEPEQPEPQPCAFCAGTGKVAVGFDGETEPCRECAA